MRIRFPWRFLLYLLPWLGACTAIFIACFPEAPTETADGPVLQAFKLPLETPLLVISGLAGHGEDFPEPLAMGLLALGFLIHAGFALSRRSAVALMSLFVVQATFVGIGVGAFIHLSGLPSGG